MDDPCLVIFDHAVESLLRRQAFVSVDSDERVAYGQHFAEVVVFVRDALAELYDVCVVGHRDIDAILAAAYEEVGLHCQSPDRGRGWEGLKLAPVRLAEWDALYAPMRMSHSACCERT